MVNKILINADDTHLWDKLDTMTQIDPAASGGISDVVLGRRPVARPDPIGPVCKSGYEEIHEIDRGFCTHITDSCIGEEWRLTATSRDSNLRLRIAFAGEAAYFSQRAVMSDESSLCSFIIRPAGDAITAVFSGGMYRYCSLNLTRDYLRKTLELEDDELPAMLLTHWDRRETAMGHFPVSKASLILAGRFFTIKSSRTWRDLEVRAISLELLRLLIDDWRNALPRLKTSMRITPTERSSFLRIRDLIQEDPAATLTISTLCKRFRMNRNKLHFGFKSIFGLSVHDFQTEQRMQLAMKLLGASKLPIAEIATRAGYSEPTNFTAAFKKHFAVLPRQIRESEGADQTRLIVSRNRKNRNSQTM